ncbi:MAG: T9SS type A sorting domain-containing protein [Sphingobacteriales bacterium]|nr:MAG: T9SS type A sorting domain-containing protein [Sphingobacteriales bacterium]
MKKTLLSLYTLALCSSVAVAQDYNFALVKDICNGCDGRPGMMYLSDNKIFFAATSAGKTATWVTDGTEAGTQMLKQVMPNGFKAFGGKVYFNGDDGTTGSELWVTDGTPGGTNLLKDINQLPQGSSSPTEFTELNGKLYFSASDGNNGTELWVTDGTTAGTTQVKDINNGAAGSNPRYMTVMGNMVYFAAENGGDIELWKSDGTSGGTTQVKDINPIGQSNPASLVVYNNMLYFSAFDGANGRELWTSDGSEAGTTMFKDIDAGGGSSTPQLFTINNGKLFFTANTAANGRELWISDGTPSGTVMVKDIDPSTSAVGSFDMVAFNNSVYFQKSDGGANENLWMSDGTAAGTQKVTGDCYAPSQLTVFGDKLYFIGVSNDGSNTLTQLWQTNGTTAGTKMVRPAGNTVTNSLGGAELTPLGDHLYFSAKYDEGTGYELWSMYAFPTSVEAVAKHDAITIYPNPATNVLHIQKGNNVVTAVSIYAITGQMLLQTTQTDIDINMLPSGNYFVHVVANGTLSAHKLVKQ